MIRNYVLIFMFGALFIPTLITYIPEFDENEQIAQNQKDDQLDTTHLRLPYDIVLLDHDMPRMTGAVAAKEILEQRPNQRLIFLSAYGNAIINKLDGVREDTIQIVQKPFSLSFLIKK